MSASAIANLIGGGIAVGAIAVGLGAAENLIRNKGKLKLAKPFKRRPLIKKRMVKRRPVARRARLKKSGIF